MLQFDLFDIYRQLLALFCGIYAVAQSIRTIHRWINLDFGPRYGPRVRRYATIHLVRIRLHRFRADVLQILVMIAILLALIQWHN